MTYKPVFGYWDMRGYAEPVRYIYHYLEIDFVDKRYPFGPPPSFDWNHWIKEKYTLGLHFPNLPYLIDGDVKITQSGAILRYLARKYNLGGETEEEKIRVDMAELQVYDFRKKMVDVCYPPSDFEKDKETYLQSLPQDLELFSKFLGDRKFLAGDKLTYVDFMFYDALDFNRMFAPGCLDNFELLNQYLKRIEAIPTIAKYMSSDDFPRNKVWKLSAHWHGS